MNIKTEPLSFYVDKLARGEHYTFARYGDGEWNAIKGKRGCNCDKHEYFKPLGFKLKRSMARPVRDPAYLYALQTQTDLTRRGDVQDFVRQHMENIPIYDSDVFHAANEAGELYPLIAQLRRMHTCVIGPAQLRGLSAGTFVCGGFIEIPAKNCFLQIDRIEQHIKHYADVVTAKDVVYCFSASMATEVMLYDLWPVLGRRNWMIDFGSLWDVFVGINSRKYHSRITTENIKKNLGQ